MSKASKGKRPRISYDKAKFAGRSILKYLLTLIVGLFVGPVFRSDSSRSKSHSYHPTHER